MDDMNFDDYENTEDTPTYGGGNAQPTTPIQVPDDETAGETRVLDMDDYGDDEDYTDDDNDAGEDYDDELPVDNRKKKIAAIAIGIVLVAGLGIGGFALASNKSEPAPEPTKKEQPAKKKADTTTADDENDLTVTDIAKEIGDLKLEGADLSLTVDKVRITAQNGEVMVTQVSDDDAAKMVDYTARRSAALAHAIAGKKVKGNSAKKVTWVATDKDGNVKVAVSNNPDTAPSGGTTAEVVNGSDGHIIADDIWNTDGVHDQGYDQNVGEIKSPTGETLTTEVKKTEESDKKDEDKKTDESDKKDSGDSSKSDNKSDSKDSSSGNSSSASAGGDNGGSSSGNTSSSSGGQSSQKKWVSEQGHWETQYSQVWVPNVVYTRHERWICSACGATFSTIGEWSAHSDAMWAQGQDHGGVIDDSYTTTEDQGHYENQATGQTWVVDVPGHWE